MALPLIALAGAGALAGGRWLMDKADKRQGEENLSRLQEYLQSSNIATERPDIAADLIDRASNSIEDASMLGRDFSATRKTNNALAAARQYSQAMETNRINMQAQQEQAAAERLREQQDPLAAKNFQASQALLNDYQQDAGYMKPLQDQYMSAQAALDNPTRLNMEAAKYNLFAILEPGGRVTQNEDGTLRETGSLSENTVNALNMALTGKAGDAELAIIRDAINRQYVPKYNGYMATADAYQKRYDELSQYGALQNPVGMMGINQDPSHIWQREPGAGSGATADAPANNNPPPVPKGMTNIRPRNQRADDMLQRIRGY